MRPGRSRIEPKRHWRQPSAAASNSAASIKATSPSPLGASHGAQGVDRQSPHQPRTRSRRHGAPGERHHDTLRYRLRSPQRARNSDRERRRNMAGHLRPAAAWPAAGWLNPPFGRLLARRTGAGHDITLIWQANGGANHFTPPAISAGAPARTCGAVDGEPL